jgi:hypothetical protein
MSNTDNAAPKRLNPRRESDDPSRAKLLSAMDDPICAMSKTESEEPKREKLRRDSEDPS